MGQMYVYAPGTGTITGTDSYCPPYSGAHPPGTGCGAVCCPTDVGGGAMLLTPVKFYASTNIVQRMYITRCAICGTIPAPWSTSVKVAMYSYAGALIGTMQYSHLKDADQYVGQGGWFWNSWGFRLGTVPDPTGCNCPNCYGGPHVHMAIVNGNGQRVVTCNTPVTAGGQAIYSFSW